MAGLGLGNPSLEARGEYASSVKVTKPLVDQIVSQSHQLPEVSLTKLAQQEVRSERLKALEHRAEGTKEMAPRKTQRALDLATEKGSPAWLTVLPHQDVYYSCIWPKEEFFCGSDTRNPLLGRCVHLAHSGSQSEHRISFIMPTRARVQPYNERDYFLTTCRITKKFSRRSNSNRKKYQHGTYIYITYLQSIRIVRGFMRVACTRKCPFVRGTGKGFLKIPVNSTSSPTFALFADGCVGK